MKPGRVELEVAHTLQRVVVATAEEDIRAGDQIEINARTGRARVARFGDATAAQIGERELADR